MKVPKISQSLMKKYVDYLNGNECGLLFCAQYIDKDPEASTPASEAMKAGIYFEYLCTGGLPRDGKIPLAEYSYKGKSNEKMAAPYERAVESAKVFKSIIKHYGIKIKKVGLSLSTDRETGILDILAEWDNQDVIIDLKYSGLIDDKWSEMGWLLESLHTKDSLMIQGVHYKILAEKVLNIKDIPFYYFVFSSANANHVKIIRQEVDESRTASHAVAITNIIGKLEQDIRRGFRPYPSMLKCAECPINHKCSSKVNVPIVEEVFY
jgi:hypothetical protein